MIEENEDQEIANNLEFLQNMDLFQEVVKDEHILDAIENMDVLENENKTDDLDQERP